jgi:hypothetical protein
MLTKVCPATPLTKAIRSSSLHGSSPRKKKALLIRQKSFEYVVSTIVKPESDLSVPIFLGMELAPYFPRAPQLMTGANERRLSRLLRAISLSLS